MQGYAGWMGNVLLDENEQVPDYLNADIDTLALMIRQIYRVQQERTYFESLVIKQDIWDTRNSFKEMIIEFIVQENN